MEMRYVPIRDLPPGLVAEVHQKIRLHSITMVLPQADDSAVACCSGTLVQLAEEVGVLTARHVWTFALKRAATVGFLVGGQEPYWIKPAAMRAFGPPDTGIFPGTNARIPDLAFVRIPAIARGTIEAARKVFYSLDARRNALDIDILGERGFWILAGSPQALFNPSTSMAGSLLYDTTVEPRIELDGWDYIPVNLNLPQNPALPHDYGGVSGGGIWRAAFYMTADEGTFLIENARRDIVLSGVAFYQTDPASRQLIAHGPRSLYAALYEHVATEIT